MPLRTIFFGTPDFALSPLESLLKDDRFLVTAAVSQTEKPAGRSQEIQESALTLFARARNLPCLAPVKIRTPQFEQWLREQQPDICVVASYGKIIPTNILAIPKHGFINIHPSLLPLYRGATPVPFTLLNGDTTTAVTIMLMSEGMDEGDILIQKEFTIAAEETSQTLLPKLFQVGADLLPETLYQYTEGSLQATPQDSAKATYSTLLTKEMGQIDWQKENAQQIVNKIRAFTPWPGVFTFLNGKRFKILEAAVLSARESEAQPGEVIKDKGVQTIQGFLQPAMVQPEGKKAMAWEDFLRGHQIQPLIFS